MQLGMGIGMQRAKHYRREQRTGATVTEFAIMAPIFFLLIAASVEFSRLNVIRHTADNAAYEAARHIMVPGANASEAVDMAEKLLNVAGAKGSVISIDPRTLTPDTEKVTVSVDIPLDQNGWIAPRFTGARTIHSESTLRTERTGQNADDDDDDDDDD